ncbi:hypothetical protein GCM10027277_50690 [Pseudoduganella ginsengisoli]
MVLFDFTQRQAWQAQWFTARRIIHAQHDLEQGAVAHRTGRLQCFHHLLKRQILVRISAHGVALDAGQQLRHGRLVIELDAQRQRIDEEADQAFNFRALPVRHRRAHDDIVLAGQARHQHGPSRQQGHEQGCAMALAQRLQARRHVGRQREARHAARIALHGGTGAVGGQFQQLRRTGQVIFPERGLRRQRVALQPVALPCRIVGILQRQWRQRVLLLLAQRRVQGGQFPHHDADRPAIGNDVVLRDQQNMFIIRQAQQLAPHQRPGRQVERRRHFLFRDALHGLFPLRGWQLAQVALVQCKTAIGGSKALAWRAIHVDERGAQAFVAGHDAVQRGLQRAALQAAFQPQRCRHVVSGARRVVEAVHEPQALLGK